MFETTSTLQICNENIEIKANIALFKVLNSGGLYFYLVKEIVHDLSI